MGSIPKTATSSDGENCSMRAPKLVASWMRSAIIAARSNVVPATAATIETPRTATSRSSHRITFAARGGRGRDDAGRHRLDALAVGRRGARGQLVLRQAGSQRGPMDSQVGGGARD